MTNEEREQRSAELMEAKKRRLAELAFEVIGSQSVGFGLTEEATLLEKTHNLVDKNKFVMKTLATVALGVVGAAIMPANEAKEVLKEVKANVKDGAAEFMSYENFELSLDEAMDSLGSFGIDKKEINFSEQADAIIDEMSAKKAVANEAGQYKDINYSSMSVMEGKLTQVEVLASTYAVKDYSFLTPPELTLSAKESHVKGGFGELFKLDGDSYTFDSPMVKPHELTTEIQQTNDAIFTQVHGGEDGALAGGGGLVAAAVAAIVISKGLSKIPSVYKLFKRNRDLNEMTLTNDYADNIHQLADNLRSLSDKDARIDALMEDMYTGDMINDFDNLLTTVITTPHRRINGLSDKIVQRIDPQKYEEAREKVAAQSADLARELIAHELATNNDMGTEPSEMARHSNDLANLVIAAHEADSKGFESSHPKLFRQMRRAGIIPESKQNIKGLGELFSSRMDKVKRVFGINNGDVLQQAKLAINIKRNLEGVAGKGMSAHPEQKEILHSISKIASESEPSPDVKVDVLDSVKMSCRGIERYLGLTPEMRPSIINAPR